MPRFVRSFFLTLALLIGGWMLSLSPVLAAPQINNQINYQARLMDASGFPVADGNYSIIFSLYDQSATGTRLWTAAGTVGVPTALTVNIQNGLFTILLGDTSVSGGSQNTLDTVNWNSDQIYLGVTINADAEMSPRKRFASAPQAFNARQLQGMYASSTASGGQTLFTLNQTEANSATGTRTALDVRTNGTSNANDFLIRGLDGTNTTVFSVNREGNATTSFLNATSVIVSVLTSSTSLNANIASFATATVAGQGICLSDGSFCSGGGGAEADTLQTVTARGSFTTTTLSLFGGLTTSNLTATGTTSLQSTTATNLAVTGLLSFSSATGVSLIVDSLDFRNATSNYLLSTTVSTTNLFVGGINVCLANGTNCQAGGSSTDLNWTFDLAGDFVRNATATTDIVIGSSTLANSPFVFLNNTTMSRMLIGQNPTLGAGADLVIGATTSSGMNSLFQLTGNDLFVAGNIGSASSIYTNGELVVGLNSTHYADGRITHLDGKQNMSSFSTYGFLFQTTGSFLFEATPDVDAAIAGDFTVNAGAGTSTLQSGGAITLQGGLGYNDGSGGSVAISGGGSGTSTFAAGGTVFIAGGPGVADGAGGGVTMTGADTFGAGNGGALAFTAGSAFVGAANAGGLSFTGGSAFGSGTAGNIVMTPGLAIGAGTSGYFQLQSSFGFAPPDMRFTEEVGSGSDYVGFRAPTSVIDTTVWVLPQQDGSSGEVLSTDGLGNLSFITAGGGGVDANWAFSAASNTLYTVTSTANVVMGGRVDAPYLNRWFTNPLLTQTIYMGGTATTTLSGTDPRGVGFDGSHIWVTDYTAFTGNVNKIDPLTNTIVATTTVGIGADGMAFDGEYMWVANGDGSDNNVSKINPMTNQVEAVVDLGSDFHYAQSVTFDGEFIWVTETGQFPSSSVVRKVDPVANTVVASVAVGVNPYGIAFDGKYLWVANNSSGNVSKVDPVANTVVATTTVGGTPVGVVSDGNSIWVSTNFGSQSVVKINPITNAVIASVFVGGNPQFMAFDGEYIWVNQAASSSVTKIDPTINAIVDIIALDSPALGGPAGIAFDGSHMWLSTPQVSPVPSTISKVPIGVADGSETTSLSLASLLVNSTTSSATGTSNYAVTIAYASTSIFGGLCVDDINTGPTCPTTAIGASIVADGAIVANRFDIAEMYSITGSAEPGDVLVLDASSTATVMRSSGVAYDSKIIGIVSTDPGFVLGWSGDTKVALSGRVPVKVSMNNGPINVGDALVSADVPGYAMKAKQPGMILGYALEGVSATGTAQVFVSVGFWAGLAFGPTGQVQVDDNGNVSIMNDLHIGGKLFPSLKGGGIQNDWYLFVNDDDSTSTYMSTNADGWMSMDTYDFAERYYSPDALEAGDLVVVSDNGRTHVQRSRNEDDMLLGIVSTRPAFIAGRPATSTFPIALSGRVPTKVSNMNGAIKAGDPLAPTTVPGVAAKAVHSGPIIGLALEDFESANIGKIEVFVNPTYWVNEDEAASNSGTTDVVTVLSQGKKGFATIVSGSNKVRIEFPSLGAYPIVQASPYMEVEGGWWISHVTDLGFEINLKQAQTLDVRFSWVAEPIQTGDQNYNSDNTYGPVDLQTGQGAPIQAATSTEPIIEAPVPDEVAVTTESVSTSTDSGTTTDETADSSSVSSTEDLVQEAADQVVESPVL